MKHIYKYPIAHTAEVLAGQFAFVLSLPKDAKILKVDEQNGKYVLWALADDFKETEDIAIAAIMTGEAIPERFDGEYIGTVMSCQGNFVSHFWKLNIDGLNGCKSYTNDG